MSTNWVVPAAANLDSVMSQLVVNAAEVPQGGNQPPQYRSTTLLNTAGIAVIRAAIQTGGRTPLSATASSVPPEAEVHAYVLTVDTMTASTPNLGMVVISMNGSTGGPWSDLVRAAKKFVADCRAGLNVTPPVDPVLVGKGPLVLPRGLFYPASGTYTNNLVVQGITYYWTPGPNETSLVCGATTLTAMGSFIATGQSVSINGVAGTLITGWLQFAQPQVNYAGGGQVRGRVDMTTDGPGSYGLYGNGYGRVGYSLATECPDYDRGFY